MEDEGRPRGGEARFIITRTIKFNKNRLQSGVGSIMAIRWKSAFSINKTSNECYEENASEEIPRSVLFPYNLRESSRRVTEFSSERRDNLPDSLTLRIDCAILHSVHYECGKEKSYV